MRSFQKMTKAEVVVAQRAWAKAVVEQNVEALLALYDFGTPDEPTLDQLDLALSVGTGTEGGGSAIAGEFAGIPQLSLAAEPASLSATEIVDFADLDQLPRPLPGHHLQFPRRLLRVPARGRLVLRLVIAADGEVREAEIEHSDLPKFERIVVSQVATWQFTPPTRGGEPVMAYALFPVPINIQ